MSGFSGDISGPRDPSVISSVSGKWSATAGDSQGGLVSGRGDSSRAYPFSGTQGTNAKEAQQSQRSSFIARHQAAAGRMSGDKVEFTPEMRTQLQQMRKEAILMRSFRDGFEGKLMGFVSLDPSPEQLRQAAKFAAGSIWDMLKKLKYGEEDDEFTSKLLALLMRIHSDYTFQHAERVSDWTMAMAGELGINDERELDDLNKSAFFQNIGMIGYSMTQEGDLSKKMTAEFLEGSREALKACSNLHDIGKMRIPREILDKPSHLTEDEYAIIKTHPVIGEEIVRPYPSLQRTIPGIRHHHERWDGSGYPDGLQEEEIPLAARIITVADSFDAMTEERPYRKALSYADAANELMRMAGRQFDPKLVSIFIKILISRGEVNVEDLDFGYGVNPGEVFE